MTNELNNAEKNLMAGLAATTARCYRNVAQQESDPREEKRIRAKAEVFARIHSKLIRSFKAEDNS